VSILITVTVVHNVNTCMDKPRQSHGKCMGYKHDLHRPFANFTVNWKESQLCWDKTIEDVVPQN
jgi:hypothetical protein